MKTQLSILLTAIAGTVISAMPAQAFYFGSFGTDGIKFDEETTVDFEFVQSYGRYRTDLRVYEVVDGEISADLGLLFGEAKAADDMVFDPNDNRLEPTNDPIGTVGEGKVISELDSIASFTFEADKEYTLGIVNYHFSQPSPLAPQHARSIVYSTSALNDGGTQQAVFGSSGGEELFEFDDASLFQEGDLYAGMVDISFDDRGNKNDKDFQDFTIKATLVESTPEPTTLAGLGMVAGGMFLSSFRKQQK